MFKIKPKELFTIKYWVHLAILVVVVLGLLQLWKHGDMFTLKNILYSIPLVGLGDVIAHTIMQID